MRPGSPLRLQPFPPTETAPALNTRHRPANRCPRSAPNSEVNVGRSAPPVHHRQPLRCHRRPGRPRRGSSRPGRKAHTAATTAPRRAAKGRADRVDTPAATQLLRSRLSPSPPPPATWIALPANPRTPRHDSRRPADRRYPYPHSFEESPISPNLKIVVMMIFRASCASNRSRSARLSAFSRFGASAAWNVLEICVSRSIRSTTMITVGFPNRMQPQLARREQHQERLAGTLEVPDQALLGMAGDDPLADAVGRLDLLVACDDLGSPLPLARGIGRVAAEQVQNRAGHDTSHRSSLKMPGKPTRSRVFEREISRSPASTTELSMAAVRWTGWSRPGRYPDFVSASSPSTQCPVGVDASTAERPFRGASVNKQPSATFLVMELARSASKTLAFATLTASTSARRACVARSHSRRVAAIRRCSSGGGRANSSLASVRQLMVGDSEPTDIASARLMKESLCMKNGKNSGRTTLDFARRTSACAEQMPSKSATASFRWYARRRPKMMSPRRKSSFVAVTAVGG